ncbi:MAG: alpha/beta hydrolase [Desulfatibacillaceae bacterium]
MLRTFEKEGARKRLALALLNRWPARIVNKGYDYYSMINEGQLRLGLQVPPDLIKSQEEITNMAVGKLALTLYHIIYHACGLRIPRAEIKKALIEGLFRDEIRLTENVIILTRKQLKKLITSDLRIPSYFYASIFEEASRRRILRESLRTNRMPAYFESEIDEREVNGRGDYETVFYHDFTSEGKEIGFRRLLSMEDVTAGDERPSVILVPGFSNNSYCWDINNKYSIARDMADKGLWVYLFDPRGMGVNRGKFDPLYTVDMLIDHDLPTVLKFVHARSKGKPSFLMGHSMGGMVSEFMVLLWRIRLLLDDLDTMTDEQKEAMNKVLPSRKEALANLRMVRGVISLGSPKHFEKLTHLLFPVCLWLNHVAKIFKFHKVPIREFFWIISQPPVLKEFGFQLINSNPADLNFLLCPENHECNREFSTEYVRAAIESVPVGLGFQFLKAIYNGEGFKRMDATRFNYSANLKHFPAEIPLFHFYGTADPLAPVSNLRYSQYYPHRIKKVYRLESARDVDKVEITPEPGQVVDFIVEGANHADLLYGKLARDIVHPVIDRIVHNVWNEWSYQEAEAESKAN